MEDETTAQIITCTHGRPVTMQFEGCCRKQNKPIILCMGFSLVSQTGRKIYVVNLDRFVVITHITLFCSLQLLSKYSILLEYKLIMM